MSPAPPTRPRSGLRKRPRPSIVEVCLLLTIAASPAAVAQNSENTPKPLGIATSVDFVSSYIWRGYDLNHRAPALQPSITYSPSQLPGASLNLWGSIGLIQDAAAGDTQTTLDEIDTTLAYQHSLFTDKLTASVSTLWYHYLSDFESGFGLDRNDVELSTGLSYALHPYFSPFLTYYRGVYGLIQGNYLEFGASASKQISASWSIAPSVRAGFSDQYQVPSRLTFVNFTLPLTFQYHNFGVTPYYSLTVPVQDLNADGKQVRSVGGLRLSYSF